MDAVKTLARSLGVSYEEAVVFMAEMNEAGGTDAPSESRGGSRRGASERRRGRRGSRTTAVVPLAQAQRLRVTDTPGVATTDSKRGSFRGSVPAKRVSKATNSTKKTKRKKSSKGRKQTTKAKNKPVRAQTKSSGLSSTGSSSSTTSSASNESRKVRSRSSDDATRPVIAVAELNGRGASGPVAAFPEPQPSVQLRNSTANTSETSPETGPLRRSRRKQQVPPSLLKKLKGLGVAPGRKQHNSSDKDDDVGAVLNARSLQQRLHDHSSLFDNSSQLSVSSLTAVDLLYAAVEPDYGLSLEECTVDVPALVSALGEHILLRLYQRRSVMPNSATNCASGASSCLAVELELYLRLVSSRKYARATAASTYGLVTALVGLALSPPTAATEWTNSNNTTTSTTPNNAQLCQLCRGDGSWLGLVQWTLRELGGGQSMYSTSSPVVTVVAAVEAVCGHLGEYSLGTGVSVEPDATQGSAKGKHKKSKKALAARATVSLSQLMGGTLPSPETLTALAGVGAVFDCLEAILSSLLLQSNESAGCMDGLSVSSRPMPTTISASGQAAHERGPGFTGVRPGSTPGTQGGPRGLTTLLSHRTGSGGYGTARASKDATNLHRCLRASRETARLTGALEAFPLFALRLARVVDAAASLEHRRSRVQAV